MISLSEILHTIAQALMIPCLIILIILMAGAVWQIGDIVVEYIAERRKHKCNVPQLLRDVHAAGADGLAELIENSGLLRRQKKALLELAESRGLPKDTLTALAERLLATEEARNARTTSITDMIAKLGPMFGLLGTLIPLGPGIVALGQGRHGDAVGVHERGIRHHHRRRHQRGGGQRHLPHPQAVVQRRHGVAGNADGGSFGGGHERC